MKKLILFVFPFLFTISFFSCLSFSSGYNPSNSIISILSNSIIIAQDNKNTYLGKICNQFNSESVFNQFGKYGSKFSSTSIWNEYSQYGSKFSNVSAFNPYSQTPPVIIKNNQIIAYLTTNQYLRGAVSPYYLLQIKDNL